MIDLSELDRLLSLVEFRVVGQYFEGLDTIRHLLDNDTDQRVSKYLTQAMKYLLGKKRGGIAFVLAEHYLRTGENDNLKELFRIDDANVKESVLNGLYGEPTANFELGSEIVRLAREGADHEDPGVRTMACYVFQNQSGWGVDVSSSLAPLKLLLQDPYDRVRHQAAYAVGNVAKKKFDMSNHIALLRRNVKHQDMYVREASAWALRKLSRAKHDIGSAVPELVWLLTDPEEFNKQRKTAAGALIYHAKKSATNASQVKLSVCAVSLDSSRKEIKKFLDQLAALD